MNLPHFEINKILYSYEDTVVAQAKSNNAEWLEFRRVLFRSNAECDNSSVMIKYQNTDYPSVALDSRWKNEFKVLRSIDSKWLIKAQALIKHKNSHILVLEDLACATTVSS